MDPLSALSISAAVVQFSDFGYRLLKSAHEIYESSSGQPTRDVEISVISNDLRRIAGDVKARLEVGDGGTTHDVFLRLCRECDNVSDELQRIFSKLKAQGSSKISLAVDSWRVALRRVASDAEVEGLVGRLGQIRQQMMAALLSLLLGEASKTGLELQQFAKQQATMAATLDRIDHATKKFSADMVGLIDTWSSTVESEMPAMARYVLSDRWKASQHLEELSMDTMDLREKYGDKLDTVFGCLFFDSMGKRETSIPKKHVSTYE
ncbi:hypothetical protein MFIFM68171_06245 [Madurella fahalii]|uniref:Fungal N-terminal domain-containing protein n=1 Tax=Madurella fahalii TaxID=1157608 RepID=A0ABQ0GER2_9PEZI